MTNKYFYITLLALLGITPEAAAQGDNNSAPRLIVNIAIDQLRSDYLEAFLPLYKEAGFKRFLNEGTVYINGTYPFAPVDRASAVAALATGVTPYYNSIIGRRWLNRETLRPIGCVDDARYPGLFTSDNASPAGISTSTIADELKVATNGKAIVYSIAPYRDAAVIFGGHAADGALWIDDYYGQWCSSQYYFATIPSWVYVYNGSKAPNMRIDNMAWEPFSPEVGKYNYFSQTGEAKPFKHKFSGDRRFGEFKTSGLINAEVTDMAQLCLANNGLGLDRVTDMLCLTYYAGSYKQETMTNCQTEQQDTYVRLDFELGRLINYIEKNIGLEHVLFVITGTGYSDDLPTDYDKYRVPSGTFYMSRTAGLLNMYLGAIYGQGNYVESTFRNQFFLNHKLLETKRISISDATCRAQEMLAMMSGVRNVYTSLQLLTGQDQQIQKIRNCYNPDRCGDIVIEAAPGWKVLNEDTHESELSTTSYTQFPIFIFGANTRPQKIDAPVSTTRIAPTIARFIRIRAPNACSSAPLF